MPDRGSLPRCQLSGRILFRRKLFVLQRLFMERVPLCRERPVCGCILRRQFLLLGRLMLLQFRIFHERRKLCEGLR